MKSKEILRLALDGVSGRAPSSQQKAAKTLLKFSGIRPLSQNDLLPDTYRNQDPFVEARTARLEALQPVNGGKREFLLWIVDFGLRIERRCHMLVP